MEQERRAGEAALTFLIASADPAFRAGVRVSLEQRAFSLVGEAPSVDTAVKCAADVRPDLCLVDMSLPGNVLGAIGRLVKAVPTSCVVVLAEEAKSNDVLAALERGALGFLLKSATQDELAVSLRAACNGEPALSRALVPLLVHQVRRGNRRRLLLPSGPVSLTAREWDVGELLRGGLGTEQIASRLGLSPITVRRHVARLTKKLGAPNREAAVEALRTVGR